MNSDEKDASEQLPENPESGGQSIPVFIDLEANYANMLPERELLEFADQRLAPMRETVAARIKQLPALMVHPGPHVSILNEARELFRLGFDYSCVTICGVTAERIALDLMLASLRSLESTREDVVASPLSDASAKALEKLPISRVIEYLLCESIIDDQLRKKFLRLGHLRNQYAHGAGGGAEKDAVEAVSLLHDIVDGTVSVFRDYEIENGKLVRKPAK